MLKELRRADELVERGIQLSQDCPVEHLQLLVDSVSTLAFLRDVLPHTSCIFQFEHALLALGQANPILDLVEEVLKLDKRH